MSNAITKFKKRQTKKLHCPHNKGRGTNRMPPGNRNLSGWPRGFHPKKKKRRFIAQAQQAIPLSFQWFGDTKKASLTRVPNMGSGSTRSAKDDLSKLVDGSKRVFNLSSGYAPGTLELEAGGVGQSGYFSETDPINGVVTCQTAPTIDPDMRPFIFRFVRA